MKKISVSFILLCAFALTAFAQHEYAPLETKELDYQNWTYKNISTDKNVSLREFAADKKLVMVFYFAPWCHNSDYQMPVTQKLYEKYKDQGFAVIGVSLYADEKRVKKELDEYQITFPVVVETTSKFRDESKHYEYRTAVGDKRKWGTPWNVFLVTGELETNGDTLTKKPVIVNGEIREDEAEKFIREKLGLPADETKAVKTQGKAETVEVCTEEESGLKKVGKN
jgi:thiol-disulfide isomerase/thioredoxin